MEEQAEELKNLLRNLEVIKSDLIERICEFENRNRAPGMPLETVYPPETAKRLLVRSFLSINLRTKGRCRCTSQMNNIERQFGIITLSHF